MLLKLQYKETTRLPVNAAFIRGSSAYVWLQELGRWSIPLLELECYVLPQSLHSLTSAGLFVVFKPEHNITLLDLIEPYSLIGDRLFIPVHTTIIPEVDANEWQHLLLWERQVFHPVIGLVGFSLADKLNLSRLLDCGLPLENNWNLAQRGISPKNKLQQIQLQQPSLEEVMASFKELIDTKSLGEILDKEQGNSSLLQELFKNLQQGSLKTALSALQKIKEAWSSADTNNKSGNAGLFDRLENWIKENVTDLEKKRNTELRRLLNLFDENTDEALKYAIPLDSPYLNRGTPAPSSTLGPHSTDFDLGKLGGGQLADSWNVHSYYHDLRTKYQHAAQKETEARDFKKAAYIYAHLLGDFQSAANVLEQGKHYREAAILYKEHLHNMSAAAGCLERGGLLLEAIEVYEGLSKYEKVGDLYQKIGQADKADGYYEQSIESALARKDYLDASRIIEEKLKKPDRVLQTLFNGWTDSNQSEACLKQYMCLLCSTNSDQVSTQLQEIYMHHTPKAKKTQLLQVITYINEGKHDPDLLETSRNIAYEIISEELQEGKLAHVHTLQKFLPEDPLISSDSSRFAAKAHVKLVAASADSVVLQLDKTIRWIRATTHRNQFLALGIKDARLHLARGNWYGNVEYFSWNDRVKTSDRFVLIADSLRSNRVILHSANTVLEEKKLARNKYFDEELVVYSPGVLLKVATSLSFNSQGGISALTANQHKMSLYQYSLDNHLQQTADCKFDSDLPLAFTPSAYLSEMIYRNGFYYTFLDDLFLKISEDGFTGGIDVNAHIRLFTASTQYAKFRIALGTDNGCLLLRQVAGELKAGSDFFAQDIKPVDMQFMAANTLVVAGKYTIAAFHINDDTVQALPVIKTQSPVVAIVNTASRKQFAYLLESGEVYTSVLDN